MGCLQLSYDQIQSPLKVVYSKTFEEYKSVQRFLSLDPKPTVGISDYSVFYNNPLLLTDHLGDKPPTAREAAAMSAHVYGNKSDKILKGGWKISNRDFGIQKNSEDGLKSQVYERTKRGATEYVYATAGTEDGTDWKHNGIQPLGISNQYKQSMTNASSISDELKKSNSELTFTGHSLGGGEAAANAYATGRDAITFNAAGVSPLTIRANRASQIDAYIMLTDPLNSLQNSSRLMPNVDGTRHYVLPRDFPSIYNGHSMDNMLKVFEPVAKPVAPAYDPNVIHNVDDLKRETNRWMSW